MRLQFLEDKQPVAVLSIDLVCRLLVPCAGILRTVSGASSHSAMILESPMWPACSDFFL